MPEAAPPTPQTNRAARRAAARRKAGAALSATALATTGAALAVSAAGPAVADTTFTVTGLGDDGSPGTLRWAIEQANATPGSDTIDFDATVSGTIELTDDLPSITEDLAIVGPGADVVTISGMDEWEILGFAGAGTSSVSGLTLTRARVENGGATHNTDDSGAALSVYGSDVSADAIVITDSYSYNDGGGAWCSEIYDEKDTDAPASLTITGSFIRDNEAGHGGGGIYASDCDLSVIDTVITGNRAGDDGGGIYFDDGNNFEAQTLLVRNTTISGNTSVEDGGGLQVDGAEPATHRIESSTVSDNDAGGYGGGIYVVLRDGATLVVSNSTISGNSATALGGALFVGAGDVTLVQTTVTLNSAAGEVEPTGVAASVVSGAVGGIVAAGYYPTSSESFRADGSDAEGPHASPVLPKGGGPPTPASVALVGTIVAANPGGDLGTGVTAVSTITASSSVIGTIDPGANVVDGGGNQTGVADPGLGPLQDNGGPTRTHALLDGSPAIDAGAVPPPTFPLDADDQRGPGYPRVMNGRIDVGAFEVQNAAIEPNFTG